jgi:hypothetical protein
MTTVTVSGTVKAAYALTSPVTTLSIAASGYIEGNKNYGVHTLTTATSGYVVLNSGRVNGGIDGVVLFHGGTVTNGAGSATSARIAAPTGVVIGGAIGTVTNLATIAIANPIAGPNACIALDDGGTATNGSSSNHAALLTSVATGSNGSANGVITEHARSTVTNFGTIDMSAAAYGNGVVLEDGGWLVNGSATDTAALITGHFGAYVLGAAGTVANYGRILGGLEVLYGGTVTNGGGGATSALISGAHGVVLASAPASLTNFGTIIGATGAGVYDASGVATVVNGSSAHAAALIEGAGAGVQLAGTVTNFGTIEGSGAGAYSVKLTSSASRLIAEAGSMFIGAANVGGGTLTVAGGAASFAGGVISSGAINGAGTLALTGGTTTLGAGESLSVAHLAVSGAATLVHVNTSLTYSGAWAQSAGTLSVAAGDALHFTGAGDSFAGTLAGAGKIVFSGGSDTLRSLTLASASINAASVTLTGTLSLSGTLAATTTHLVVGASATGSATLTGGGRFVLSNLATNTVIGAGAAARLINVNDKILGAGQLGDGQMSLTNEGLGLINGDDTVALIINTGTSTIVNAGTIEATGSGGVDILSPIRSTGVMYAAGGTLTVDGAVTGTGVVKINNGAAVFATAFSEKVLFLGPGILALSQSRAYAGSISGLSLTGTDTLDLKDIAFSGATEASFSGTTTSGVLTVTDGTHTAKISLTGNYLASAFTVASDGSGGTNVVDPPAVATAAGLTAAMATFGAVSAPAMARAADHWRAARPLLAAPGPQVA